MHQLEAIAAWWPALGALPALYGLWWVYRLAGWRGVVIVLTLGAGAFLYRKGASDKEAAIARDREAERVKAIKVREGVDHEVNEMDADTVNRQLDQWLRDKR